MPVKKWFLMLLLLPLAMKAGALPPEIELDQQLMQAAASLKAGEFDAAIKSMEAARKLGQPLPENFWFHFGRASGGAQHWKQATEAYEKYLGQFGKQAKYYREALEGLGQARNELTKAAERAAKELGVWQEHIARCPDEYREWLADTKAREREANYAWQHGPVPGGCFNHQSDPACESLDEVQEALQQELEKWEGRESRWCEHRYPRPE